MLWYVPTAAVLLLLLLCWVVVHDGACLLITPLIFTAHQYECSPLLLVDVFRNSTPQTETLINVDWWQREAICDLKIWMVPIRAGRAFVLVVVMITGLTPDAVFMYVLVRCLCFRFNLRCFVLLDLMTRDDMKKLQNPSRNIGTTRGPHHTVQDT